MNLQILTKSRRRVREGDIFYLSPIRERYYFGRVTKSNVTVGPWSKCHLIYIYDEHSPDCDTIPELSRDALLVAPMIVDSAPWREGIFCTVLNAPLSAADVFPRHCFYNEITRDYFDEFGTELKSRIEPCGDHSLTLPRGVDRAVSLALGLSVCED